jgi:ABC-type metal ion transport system, ATPase component
MERSIELKNITKQFQTPDGPLKAIHQINLQVERGEIWGIIGMSGAGKSTLIRCINFLEKPTEGEVFIEGRNLGLLSKKELREARRDIGMIFQNFNLLMQRNVLDNVCLPLEIAGKTKKEARERSLELLKIVGLEEKAKAYPAQLSGGQKQRTAIARALAGDPKILLCDEATSALDPATTNSILELLQKINKELGITIVLITHEMSVVQKICSHVAILEKGMFVDSGNIKDILEKNLIETENGMEMKKEIEMKSGGEVKWK